MTNASRIINNEIRKQRREGKIEGIAEGKAEGKAEGIALIAKKLKGQTKKNEKRLYKAT